jgi:hypothetical protein
LRLILIRTLALIFPLLLFTLALYICEREFYRLLGSYLVELPPYQPLLSPPDPVAAD